MNRKQRRIMASNAKREQRKLVSQAGQAFGQSPGGLPPVRGQAKPNPTPRRAHWSDLEVADDWETITNISEDTTTVRLVIWLDGGLREPVIAMPPGCMIKAEGTEGTILGIGDPCDPYTTWLFRDGGPENPPRYEEVVGR